MISFVLHRNPIFPHQATEARRGYGHPLVGGEADIPTQPVRLHRCDLLPPYNKDKIYDKFQCK